MTMNFEDIDKAKRVIGRELRRNFPEVEQFQFSLQMGHDDGDHQLLEKLQSIFPRRQFADPELGWQLWVEGYDGPLVAAVERITDSYTYADDKLVLARLHTCPDCNSAIICDEPDKFECYVCHGIDAPPEPTGPPEQMSEQMPELSDAQVEKEMLVIRFHELLSKLVKPERTKRLLQGVLQSIDRTSDQETLTDFTYRLIAGLKKRNRELRRISDRTGQSSKCHARVKD
jgi:hypothetical protein